MYDGAVAANAAYEQARAMWRAWKPKPTPPPPGAPRSRPWRPLAGRTGGRALPRRGAVGPADAERSERGPDGAAMSMQDAEVAPTARQVAACEAARDQYREVMERWEALRVRAGARDRG